MPSHKRRAFLPNMYLSSGRPERTRKPIGRMKAEYVRNRHYLPDSNLWDGSDLPPPDNAIPLVKVRWCLTNGWDIDAICDEHELSEIYVRFVQEQMQSELQLVHGGKL